jgi:hypothetical protein
MGKSGTGCRAWGSPQPCRSVIRRSTPFLPFVPSA